MLWLHIKGGNRVVILFTLDFFWGIMVNLLLKFQRGPYLNKMLCVNSMDISVICVCRPVVESLILFGTKRKKFLIIITFQYGMLTCELVEKLSTSGSIKEKLDDHLIQMLQRGSHHLWEVEQLYVKVPFKSFDFIFYFYFFLDTFTVSFINLVLKT